MSKAWVKLLTISVNCGIILSKRILLTLKVLSSTITSLISNVVSFITFNNERLTYIRTSIRDVTSVKFISIISSTEKLRQVTLVKFRTLFANKDTQE